MGLTIVDLRSGSGPSFKLNRKLWLARDPKTAQILEEVVEDGDPRAGSLLGKKGDRISRALAERLGLTGEEAATDPQEPAEGDEKAPEAPGTDEDVDGVENGSGDEPEYYEDMTVEKLKEILSERGLPVSGNKQELIDRLTEDDESAETE